MRRRKVAVIVSVICGVGLFVGAWWAQPVPIGTTAGPGRATTEAPPRAGLGSVRKLRSLYNRWKVQHERNGGDRNIVLALGWSKGLSAKIPKAKGRATLDLIGGSVSVEVHGLSEEGVWDVWLVDNRPGPGHSVRPEHGDEMIHLGSLEDEGDVARLEADLGEDAFKIFDVDLVIVSRDGVNPEKGGVLCGSPTLFQRLYRSARKASANRGQESGPGFFGPLAATPAHADPPPPSGKKLQKLIAEGRDIYFNETFDGNGRTCATCHPATNNFTIDPEFIATLPDSDPLFVAEPGNPNAIPALIFGDLANLDLAGNPRRFENVALMRAFGLIVENIDGFQDLENKFVMRGVPHVLAMSTSTEAGPDLDDSVTPPDERTGWSGDGAPSDAMLGTSGRLRDFPVGAVIQHFPLRPDREPGVDFRLPTDKELDALEAFYLSLGRQGDLDLPLNLKGDDAAAGQAIFVNDGLNPLVAAGKCNLCHFNAGANAKTSFLGPLLNPIPPAVPDGTVNLNFNTGVEQSQHPAERSRLRREPRPIDGGFGINFNPDDGSFGNATFNTPPLVEAADTGPFFHDNSVQTLEGAINFYNTGSFNGSPAGILIGGIVLIPTEVNLVGIFLRVINALENIRSARDSAGIAKGTTEIIARQDLLAFTKAEIEDATTSLQDAPFRGSPLHPDAVNFLLQAKAFIVLAAGTANIPTSNSFISQADGKLVDARDDMVTP